MSINTTVSNPLEVFHKLDQLYSRLNDNLPPFKNDRSPYEHLIVPPTSFIAKVIADLHHAADTWDSLAFKYKIIDPNPPDPEDDLQDLRTRIQRIMPEFQDFVRNLELDIEHKLGPPGKTTLQISRQIMENLGYEFGAQGRVFTAEIWGWIARLAKAGMSGVQ